MVNAWNELTENVVQCDFSLVLSILKRKPDTTACRRAFT